MSFLKKNSACFSNYMDVLLSLDAIYSLIEMRTQNYQPLELCFMKMCTAGGAIGRNSIICFCVEGPSYYTQSCLNLQLLLCSTQVV